MARRRSTLGGEYDWTGQFAPIAAAVAKLKIWSAILDGEAVALDKDVGRRRCGFCPQLQAEVAYSNVTADGMLRHGILKGLRLDLTE